MISKISLWTFSLARLLTRSCSSAGQGLGESRSPEDLMASGQLSLLPGPHKKGGALFRYVPPVGIAEGVVGVWGGR